MTDELKRVAGDPNYAVQFAVGSPVPNLAPQSRGSGIEIAGIYFNDVKRFVLKSAHLSVEDVRIFDGDSGQLVYVSHHPGKNPYDALDPLGLTNIETAYNVAGGEWESLCDVTGYLGMPSFRVRPKSMSFHGRQYIKVGDETIMNIGKLGKFKTKSLRPHFGVLKGSSGDVVYKCVADMMGRTVAIYNEEDQLVAQIAKTTKALILTAAFGSGSESTIDIAAGVDCSTILAVVFGMNQVGQHFMSDAFSNYVTDPLKDNVVDGAVDGVMDGGVEGAVEGAAAATGVAGLLSAFGGGGDGEGEEAAEEAFSGGEEEDEGGEETSILASAGRFVFENFFAGGEEE